MGKKEDPNNENIEAVRKPYNRPNLICEECARWDEYGDKCYYYWNNKTECTKFCLILGEPDQFIIEELAIRLRNKIDISGEMIFPGDLVDAENDNIDKETT